MKESNEAKSYVNPDWDQIEVTTRKEMLGQIQNLFSKANMSSAVGWTRPEDPQATYFHPLALRRAEEFLTDFIVTCSDQIGSSAVRLPILGACFDGSIDLHWHEFGKEEMLINVSYDEGVRISGYAKCYVTRCEVEFKCWSGVHAADFVLPVFTFVTGLPDGPVL